MSIKATIKKHKWMLNAARAVLALPYPFMRTYMRLCHAIRHVDGKKVFFSSFEGTLYNDNPRAVAEALLKADPTARIVYRLNERGQSDPALPKQIDTVPHLSLGTLRELATSRVIVTNAAMKRWMVKFDDQFYIQTWHGDRGFKRIHLDLDPDNRFYLMESTRIDLAVSGSDFGTRVFQSAMAVPREKIIECGCPRNDRLVNRSEEEARRVRRSLQIPDGVRVLMYAPTFRVTGTGERQQAELSLEKVRETLERATGEKWLCVTRGHSATRGVRSDAAMDVSDMPETNALLTAVDMLITDYSSIGGDFVLLGRPTIFYQPDRSAYDRDRGLYFDPDESPLIVAHTEDELLNILSNPIDAAANCRAYLDFFGAHETGHAAETVAKRIMEELR